MEATLFTGRWLQEDGGLVFTAKKQEWHLTASPQCHIISMRWAAPLGLTFRLSTT
jgi:hypothetical protein